MSWVIIYTTQAVLMRYFGCSRERRSSLRNAIGVSASVKSDPLAESQCDRASLHVRRWRVIVLRMWARTQRRLATGQWSSRESSAIVLSISGSPMQSEASHYLLACAIHGVDCPIIHHLVGTVEAEIPGKLPHLSLVPDDFTYEADRDSRSPTKQPPPPPKPPRLHSSGDAPRSPAAIQSDQFS